MHNSLSYQIPSPFSSSVKLREPAQRPQAGHEAVFAAAIDYESGQSFEAQLVLTSGSFSVGAPMNLPSFAHSL
jgi:hypothetical protein